MATLPKDKCLLKVIPHPHPMQLPMQLPHLQQLYALNAVNLYNPAQRFVLAVSN